MTLLAERKEPPAILPRAQSVTDFAGPWLVAQAVSRAEKKLAWHLCDNDIGYFLPMRTKLSVYRGERRRSLLPLFPCYIFVADGDAGRSIVQDSHQVCRIIEIADQQKFIREITSLEKALDIDPRLHACDWTTEGKQVRVAAGHSMEGTFGIIEHIDERARLIIRISTLGQSVSMEIDPDFIEPI